MAPLLVLLFENMLHDLVNFLPRERVDAFRRMYTIRMLCVVAIGVTFVTTIHVALITPTYIYIHKEYETRKSKHAVLISTQARNGHEEISKRLDTLSAGVARLQEFLAPVRTSDVIRALLQVPHPKVQLHGIHVAVPAVQGGQTQIQISGVASSREALRTYHLALLQWSFVQSADLPLSVYAKESDIPFSISIAGQGTP